MKRSLSLFESSGAFGENMKNLWAELKDRHNYNKAPRRIYTFEQDCLTLSLPSPSPSIVVHKGSPSRYPSLLPEWLWMVYSVLIDALLSCKS